MNFNHKNYKDIKYVTQEEIDKMSYNEKFFPPCKCGKKGEFRWKKSESTYHEDYDKGKKGMFYAIVPYKGSNGEEVCHKCAPCVRCGKEGASYSGRYKYEKTNESPSGEWILAYCNVDCLNGEKPNLPKKEPREVESCNYCGKLTEVKFGNTNTEKTFCSRNCYVAAGNEIQKGKCRIAGCSQEAYYECMDLCLSHSKPCRGGKRKPNGRVCNAAMGTDKGDICEFCKDQTETYLPNPAAPAPQSITNSESKDNQSDNSVKINPGNSPQSNQGQDKSSETKNDVKTIKFENKEDNSEKTPPKSAEKPNQEDTQTLIINLRNIKKITLTPDGNLVIEFNKLENNSQKIQTITTEQISKSQELQTIKSYCQKNGKTSLSQQELSSIISANTTATEKPKDGNNFLLIGGIGVALIFGIGIGLLLKKKKVKKN